MRYFFLAFLVLAVIAFWASSVVRGFEIEACESRGGSPITYPWHSERYFEVACVR